MHGAEGRKPAHQRGYDKRWEKLRNSYIKAHPLCVMCTAMGRTTEADLVDHIRPIAQGGARLDQQNLQSLCRTCHAAKTRRDGSYL